MLSLFVTTDGGEYKIRPKSPYGLDIRTSLSATESTKLETLTPPNAREHEVYSWLELEGKEARVAR